MEVSALGFGGAETGYGHEAADVVARILNRALDAGLNVIDTAECYGSGESLIGETVSHRRSEYFLFTKCGHAAGLEGQDWSPDLLERSIERSLQRLRTDYVDIIHLHTCSRDLLEQGDVIAVLQRAKTAGKTRFIGYSGDGQAALYAVQSGVFDSLETSLSIADQQAIDLTIPAARERQMGVVIKRPVANAAWKYQSAEENTYAAPYRDRLLKLNYPFLTGSLQEAVSTALRFTLSVPGVHCAIVGTRNPDRWAQNAAAVEAGPLPPEQFEAIRARWREVAAPDWVGLG